MAAHGEVVLRLRVCFGSDCRATFFVCPRCDRGQRYCSLHCREQARLHQRRCANRRHQQSPEGRLDHRDRQRKYRRRRAQARVTDQGSLLIISPSSSGCGPIDAIPVDVPSKSGDTLPPRWPEKRPGVWPCCRICGRSGRFVDPFPRIPRRR
jgi:hypothetical protein